MCFLCVSDILHANPGQDRTALQAATLGSHGAKEQQHGYKAPARSMVRAKFTQ